MKWKYKHWIAVGPDGEVLSWPDARYICEEDAERGAVLHWLKNRAWDPNGYPLSPTGFHDASAVGYSTEYVQYEGVEE